MINLEDYSPNIDTTKVSDEALELWYGKINTIFLRLIEGYEIKYDIDSNYHEQIVFFKKEKFIMDYFFNEKELWINDNLICQSEDLKKFDRRIVKKNIKKLAHTFFKFKLYVVETFQLPEINEIENHFYKNEN